MWVDTQGVQPWCILPAVCHQSYSNWLVDILLFLVLAWMWDWYVKECVWRTLYSLQVTDNLEVFTAIPSTIIFTKNTVNCLTHVAHCDGNFSFLWIFVPESVRNCVLGFSYVVTVEEQCVLMIWPEAIGDTGNLFLGSNIQKRALFWNTLLNPLNPELNPICHLLALLGAHHFLHLSRIRVSFLTLRRLMSYIYGAPILDVSRSHTTTQHSR